MCGISGSVNFPLSYSTIDGAMHHRGPDEQHGFTDGNVDLFHLRLSILDIKGGTQPMHLDGRFTILFNGQIYNHNEIRYQFKLSGETYSDTETLLLLYREFGHDMLQYLDGMFIIVIYDKKEKKIFIARDRAGKKPLYIFNDGLKIVFASELNCLKQLLPLEMDENNFHHFLRLGAFYRKATPYKNVTELPSGTFLEINCSNLKCVEKKYWDIHDFYHFVRLGAFYRKATPYKNVTELPSGTFLEINCSNLKCVEKKYWDIHDFYNKPHHENLDDTLAMIDGLLHNSVKRRIDSSDLEVGCFLSGGIDSGLVTSVASKYKSNLSTFTVSFNGEYDEAPLARLVAEKYQTRHTEIKISFDHLQDDVEQILGNYGEPFFDSSAIPSYYVSREAKKYLTVILNGDGADELFGGYRRYVPFSRFDFFNNNPVVRHTAGILKSLMPHPKNKKSTYNYLYRLAALASKSGLDIYLSAGVDILEDYEQAILQKDLDYMMPVCDDFERIISSGLTGLQKIMNMDFDTNLFSDLLVKMDIANMAHSLEGRSPFLCKEMLEFAPGMKDQMKINGSTTKFLLRTLAKKYLPEPLINQPKRGFEIPLMNWVDHELKEIILDYVASPNALSRRFINNDFILQLLNNKMNMAPEKRAKILWMLFSMEVWYKRIYLK